MDAFIALGLASPQGSSEWEWRPRQTVFDYYRILGDCTVDGHLAAKLTGELAACHTQLIEQRGALGRICNYDYVSAKVGVCGREDVRFCSSAVLEYAFWISQVLFDQEKLKQYVQGVAGACGRFLTKLSRYRNAVVRKLCEEPRIDRRAAEGLFSSTVRL